MRFFWSLICIEHLEGIVNVENRAIYQKWFLNRHGQKLVRGLKSTLSISSSLKMKFLLKPNFILTTENYVKFHFRRK